MHDRENVIKGLESLRDICNAKSNMAIGKGKTAWAGYANSADDALSLLREQPEQKFFVDIDGKITPLPKQKHGTWIPIKTPTGVKYGGFEEYTVQEVMCSECGFTDDVSASIYTYCPECGAKMDEE